MLEVRDCCLAIIDVQGKLAQLMADKEALFKNIQILIQAAKILEIPVLWCQQVPESLGPTLPEIADLLAGTRVAGAGPQTRNIAFGVPVLPSNRGQDARDTRVWEPVGPIDKACFSCCGAARFRTELGRLDRKQVLLCGIETHVCVYQTALDLMQQGFEVSIIADAVSSRTAQNRQIALTRLAAEGARLSSTEMALFELLKTAQHPQFRQIARLVK